MFEATPLAVMVGSFIIGYLLGHAAGRSSGKVAALEEQYGLGGEDDE